MIIPIVCDTQDCTKAGQEVNRVSGILPPDLDLFYEGHDGSELEDQCPVCGQAGVAEDPIFEHEWEKKYFDKTKQPGHAIFTSPRFWVHNP
jgi:hypothetical protein